MTPLPAPARGRPRGAPLALQRGFLRLPTRPAAACPRGERASRGATPGPPGGCYGRPRGRVVPPRSPAPPAALSDPDNVVLCLLAADEDDDRDVALQIHFTLIQAFCCENDINILRVSNPGRLAELLLLEPDASPAASEGAEQPPDLHCVLVTVSERGLRAGRS